MESIQFLVQILAYNFHSIWHPTGGKMLRRLEYPTAMRHSNAREENYTHHRYRCNKGQQISLCSCPHKIAPFFLSFCPRRTNRMCLCFHFDRLACCYCSKRCFYHCYCCYRCYFNCYYYCCWCCWCCCFCRYSFHPPKHRNGNHKSRVIASVALFSLVYNLRNVPNTAFLLVPPLPLSSRLCVTGALVIVGFFFSWAI